MTEPLLAADRAWCRSTLPRVSRTFALNIRVLADPLREAVEIGYLLCRTADVLEDSWPGTAAEIRARFERLLAGLGGDAAAATALAAAAPAMSAPAAERDLLAGFPRVLRAWRALLAPDRDALDEGVRTLAAGMCRYATRAAERRPGVPYLDTEDELRDYCWTVAGCVGVMLTRLFGAHEGAGPARGAPDERRRLELAPAVGEGLQLTNILLDWPIDVRRGRCYLPAEWLAEHGLEPSALVGAARPATAVLAGRLEERARAALGRVPDYLDAIPARATRYRLFTLWPALWALASLEHARADPEFPWGERRPRLGRRRLWREVARGLLGHRAGARSTLRWPTPAAR